MKTIIFSYFFFSVILSFALNLNHNSISEVLFKIPYKKYSNVLSGEYTKIKINCNEYNCKKEFGVCSEDKQYCLCKNGFIHSPKVTSKKRLCGYKKYNGIASIILELFLPGLGVFYLNNYSLGFLKICLFPSLYYSWDKYKGVKKFFISLIGYSLIIYHLKDLFLLFGKNMEDRNGIFPY